jgi:hypothetical protein
MERRTLIGRLSRFVIGLALAARIPPTALPRLLQGSAALDYVRGHFNRYCAWAASYTTQYPNVPIDATPAAIVVSRWLYEAVQWGLIQRHPHTIYLVENPHPRWKEETCVFKGVILASDSRLTGTEVRCLQYDDWMRHVAMLSLPPGVSLTPPDAA